MIRSLMRSVDVSAFTIRVQPLCVRAVTRIGSAWERDSCMSHAPSISGFQGCHM